jgi:hypothetical protein
MIDRTFLRGLMETAGNPFEIERDGEVHTEDGVLQQRGAYVSFYPDADVRVGDVLRRPGDGEVFYVIRTAPRTIQGKTVGLHAYYETERARSARQAYQGASGDIHFHDSVQESIIGVEQHAEQPPYLDMRALEIEIDRRGGLYAQDLKRMLEEIRTSPTLERGFLAQFGGLVERHPWIMRPLAQVLLDWARRRAGGP